jgi:hypothetical protein
MASNELARKIHDELVPGLSDAVLVFSGVEAPPRS